MQGDFNGRGVNKEQCVVKGHQVNRFYTSAETVTKILSCQHSDKWYSFYRKDLGWL